MENSSIFVALLCISMCWLIPGSLTVRVNRTVTKSPRSEDAKLSSIDLQNDRNRRLIPYNTYYVSNHHGQSNSVQNNPTAEEENVSSAPRQTSRPLITTKKPPHYVYTEEFHQDPNHYNYIPIAYIPGVRGVNYQQDPHYFQQTSLNKNPTLVNDGSNKLFATASPIYTTTTTPSSENKVSFAYYSNDYLTQPGSNSGGNFFSYLNAAPITNPKTILKPTYVAATPKAPVLFSTPQTDYLDFRYSELYKTQAPKYDITTTPPTVEITSPKHYTVSNAAAFAATPSSPQNHLSSSTYQQLPFNYPEVAHFAYSPPIPPRTKLQTKPIVVSKSPEPVTQPTKTLMTIMKSQEIRYPTDRPEYGIQYVQQQPYANAVTAPPEFTVDDVFNGYNINKQLPERITPDNLKDSIKTLSYILQILQKADSITQFQHNPGDYSSKILETLKDVAPLSSPEEHKAVNTLDNADVPYETYDPKTSPILQDKPLKDDQNTPGRAGIDYPTMSVIPQTSFSCKTQRYKGFFADPDTKCQVWHYCDLNGGQASFLCPNGTIFNQAALTCDWWFNVKCASTPQLYVLNERLYKYIIPMRPSFPEDYSGPLVDQYLTEKFKEIESKRKYRYPSNSTTVKTDPISTLNMTAAFQEHEIPAHLLNENL